MEGVIGYVVVRTRVQPVPWITWVAPHGPCSDIDTYKGTNTPIREAALGVLSNDLPLYVDEIKTSETLKYMGGVQTKGDLALLIDFTCIKITPHDLVCMINIAMGFICV